MCKDLYHENYKILLREMLTVAVESIVPCLSTLSSVPCNRERGKKNPYLIDSPIPLTHGYLDASHETSLNIPYPALQGQKQLRELCHHFLLKIVQYIICILYYIYNTCNVYPHQLLTSSLGIPKQKNILCLISKQFNFINRMLIIIFINY